MGRRLKHNVAILMVWILFFLQCPLFPFQVNEVQAANENTPLKYYKDSNYRYFVGMMYYEMWKDTAGNWTDGGRQPNKGMRGEAEFTYKFQFPNRKIKSVNARIYTPSDPLVYFEESRSDSYDEYKKSISLGTTNSDIRPFNKQGIGTDTTIIPITINMLLNAERPHDVKGEQCPNCAANVEAYRIYVPMLFKIELQSQLNVKYYDTDGQSLNNIFTPIVNEELIAGKEYTFTPPTNADFEYVGFKKSTTDELPHGSINSGSANSFKYDGSFEKYTLFMYYKKKDDNTTIPSPGPSGCTVPVPAESIEGKYMDPVVTAKIRADERGSEQFDVLQGIPTSESLYGNVLARDHLYKNKFVQMTGTCTFSINVTKVYTLKWDPGKEVTNANGSGTHTEPDPQSQPEPKTYQYIIERPYKFWKIDNLEVYKIKQSILKNYALPGDQITIQPSGYTPPNFTASTNGNYYPPTPPSEVEAPGSTISGGTTKPSVPNEDLKGLAERAVQKVKVENDTLIFKGQKIMDSQRVDELGPRPVQIPEPLHIGDNVLYSSGNMISSNKENRKDTPSTGEIFYDLMSGNINGGENQTFTIFGINTVTVHTPVVDYSSISDDQAHNQKTNPNMQRSALILERPFIVKIPTSGQHTNYLGYGNRDYAKYYRTKQVKFPFDVYTGDRKTFIPKKTWVDVPVGQLTTTFYLPVWVDEGDYQVSFRNIAENAPSSYTAQDDANTNLIHHAAADEVSVEVIGRLYDFHITDISDYNWERVFRTKAGTALQTGVSYWVGQNKIDGDPRGNSSTYTLPIRPGSNPLQGYKNVAVKTGYHFKFDFLTKGNMFGPLDGIRITPRFYYVRKDGKAINNKGETRVPVDLYYHTNQNQFVKIGSKQDQVKRYVLLNDRLRNVPVEELSDTASYKFNHYGQAGSLNMQQFISYYTSKFTKQKTPVGAYDLLLLPEQIRTFLRLKDTIPSSVDQERANVSIQKWYGEYSLPAAAYVVEAGLNVAEYGRTHGGLDEKSAIFLKNGYVVVNFNIESIQEGNLKKPHLQYMNAPLMNQWNMEGFNRNIQDAYGNRFTLKDGDVLFYNADQSSRDDFSSQVPH
ncbi:DUF5704 domain-containing protein [Paenibacillus pini]|uniref:DUF5704 domain-containing protein n=1 Tax=Paenibacillus pini JCM 16418 TaxID=1236976 RepID=W7Y603_9BACL|nr:DUF5704 domain-containing protein [Paenibacillus pini]GAF06250.1 hypothetical protein JCM16418_200 [Paenibacillus pini JCM 16418]